MKKSLSKIGVALISATMIMSMVAAMPVSAATTTEAQEKITSKSVTMPIGSATYTIYQIAEATYDEAGKIYTYTLKNDFGGMLEVDAKDGLIKQNGKPIHLFETAAQQQQFAKDLADAKDKATAMQTGVAGGTEMNFDPGYYLIVGEGTTKVTEPILLSVVDSAAKQLENKASEITVDKKITKIEKKFGETNGKVAANGKTGIADKGAIVSYSIETTIPTYAPTVKSGITPFQIIDLPEDVLTVNKDTIKVTVNGNEVVDGTDYDLKFGIKELEDADLAFTGSVDKTAEIISNTAFKVVFKEEFVLADANRGKGVVVTFDATVGEGENGMDVDENANNNTSILSYSNDYNDGIGNVDDPSNPNDPKPKTETSAADVFCTIFTANKVSGGTTTPLAGAKFALFDEKGTELRELALAANNADGATTFKFEGLSDGTYVLKETKTPDGYKKADDITFTVVTNRDSTSGGYNGKNFVFSGDVDSNEINVENYPGQLLPGTGGAGTILFTVGGAAVVLLAGVLFVFYMKKRRIEE